LSLNTSASETPPEPNPCFADSRRLTGHNRFFAGPGVVLETLGPTAQDAAAHARWQASVTALCAALGWPAAQAIVRRHASGTLLAIAAPADTLFTATEVNEWAWERASGIFDSGATLQDDSPFDQLYKLGETVADVAAVFAARAAAERNPSLAALRNAAQQHHLPLFVDDEAISLGAGAGSRTWPLTALPAVADVPWDALRNIPTALVTGSNGKTTTVRLLAAMIDASSAKFRGHVGYSSTEGVMIGGAPAGDGDFSGPAGARLVLRDPRVEAAVLETARGGILRRGLAVDHADVAIVTNISADHFGEYGIDSLNDLADVKLVTARALNQDGTLVLNADDPVLRARIADQKCHVALFAMDDTAPALAALRKNGGSTCGAIDGELWLMHRTARTSLGKLHEMPLTVGGVATYNAANISAAALGAAALGVPAATIAAVLTRFGSTRHDNPGRLDRWNLADITVLIDYAHNPSGLAMLLAASRAIQHSQGTRGRLGLLLGQAGNRTDQAITDIARVAASFHPDLIVLKEIATMLRGRAPGEVPAMLKQSLLAAGFATDNIESEPDEIEAARRLLRWARAGDAVVLPIHQSVSRQTLSALLDRLEETRWRARDPLNDENNRP
jgi:cyanophycin synthetase